MTSSRRRDRKPQRQNRSNNLGPESLCENSRSQLGSRRTRRAQSQEQVRGSGCHLRDPSPKASRSGPEGKAQPTASPREDAAHPHACFRGPRGAGFSLPDSQRCRGWYTLDAWGPLRTKGTQEQLVEAPETLQCRTWTPGGAREDEANC